MSNTFHPNWFLNLAHKTVENASRKTEDCMPVVQGFSISYVLPEKCYKFWTHEKVFISRQKLYNIFLKPGEFSCVWVITPHSDNFELLDPWILESRFIVSKLLPESKCRVLGGTTSLLRNHCIPIVSGTLFDKQVLRSTQPITGISTRKRPVTFTKIFPKQKHASGFSKNGKFSHLKLHLMGSN